MINLWGTTVIFPQMCRAKDAAAGRTAWNQPAGHPTSGRMPEMAKTRTVTRRSFIPSRLFMKSFTFHYSFHLESSIRGI